MKIAQIVPSLEEKYGGPSRSVRKLAAALAALGQDVDLLSTRPGQGADPVQEGRLHVLQFRRDRPEFLCPSSGLREHLRSHSYDCIHHHALWLRTLDYSRRCAESNGLPLVISPRGMMTDWSWQHHRWRKMLAGQLVHPGAIARADGWHATSDDEADDIRRRGIRQPVCVAPNGVERPTDGELAVSLATWTQLYPALAGRPVALFYSRFHRKKRLLELIDLWVSTAPREWVLLVAGIPEEYTTEDLAARVRRHSASDRIVIADGGNRSPPYGVASLFLLPSHTENFGMAIAEAMAWGVPVLVTDTTPWAEVAARDLGWCVPWAAYPATLRAALGEPADRLELRGSRARDWVLARYSWQRAAEALIGFYEQLR